MLANIQDNTHKAFVALQSYVTSPANIPIPGVVHTDRPKLTREQMAARYLKSVKGNSNIDINKPNAQEKDKTPAMIQKSSHSQIKDQWASIPQIDTSDEIKTYRTARTLLDTQNCESGLSVRKYLAAVEKSGPLTYEYVGFGNLDTACLADTPEFIVCSNQHLRSLKARVSDYPSQELQIRSSLGGDASTNPERINAEIHAALQKNKATRVYLTSEQLDSYTSWQLSHGGSLNFQYIRVDDTEKVNASRGLTLAGIVVVSSVLLTIAAGCAVMRKKEKSDKTKSGGDHPNPRPVAKKITDNRIGDGTAKNRTVAVPDALRDFSTSTEESSDSATKCVADKPAGDSTEDKASNTVEISKYNDVVVDIHN
jgi:hypothetical protein